ncbi:MAG: acetate kinase, partial [Candidatus Omnitrophota bacterium]
MYILVINCGSSSAKYDLFDVENESSISRGIVERIGEGNASLLRHEAEGKGKVEEEVACADHHNAIEIIRDILTDAEKGVLENINEVLGVGHRVVHGGEEFNESTLIDDKVLKSVEKYSELAPLHNPPSLEGIRSSMKIFKNVPQVAVFDTAFHQTMPENAFCYGIPYELYEKYGIRKYGFHGTSHRYVSMKAAELLARPLNELNLITVHLG